jgi:uncharacterized membrane protein YbhN (UPF0104 family)
MTFVAVDLLLAQIGSLRDVGPTLARAEWAWVGLAFVFSLLTYPTSAVALQASLPNRLPFGRVTELQLAGKFAGLVTPGGFGSDAMDIRFLQGQGVGTTAAVTSGVAISLLRTIGEWSLFALCAWSTKGTFSLGGLPPGLGKIGLVVVIALAVAAALVHRVPKLRQKVVPQIRSAWDTVAGLVKSPKRTLLIIGPGIVGALLYALCLGSCLKAYGGHLSLATLVVINTGASTVANATPVPGGMGVAEAGLTAGLTAAGIPSTIAVAAVMTHRILTFWLPPLGGWVAMRDLTRRKYI